MFTKINNLSLICSSNQGIRGRVVSASQSRHVYTFDMSSLPAGSEVMMAELRIYKELPNHSIHKPNATHRHGVTGGLTSLHQVTTNNSQGGGDSPSTLRKVDERLVFQRNIFKENLFNRNSTCWFCAHFRLRTLSFEIDQFSSELKWAFFSNKSVFIYTSP